MPQSQSTTRQPHNQFQGVAGGKTHFRQIKDHPHGLVQAKEKPDRTEEENLQRKVNREGAGLPQNRLRELVSSPSPVKTGGKL